MMFLWLACTSNPSVEIDGIESFPSVVTIPSGTYQIGPSDGISVPHTFQRSVTLTYSFAIQSTEVTYSQWLEVTPNIPDQYCDSDVQPHDMSPVHPVRCVSWCNAIVFANQKSRVDGYLPAYDMTDTFTAEVDAIYCNEQAQFVRLNQGANGGGCRRKQNGKLRQPHKETIMVGTKKTRRSPSACRTVPANNGACTTPRQCPNGWERFGDYELTIIPFQSTIGRVYTSHQRRIT